MIQNLQSVIQSGEKDPLLVVTSGSFQGSFDRRPIPWFSSFPYSEGPQDIDDRPR
jgi:hypothetical protein